jgi:hypothetical protein
MAWHDALTHEDRTSSTWLEKFEELLRVVMHDQVEVEMLRSNRVGGRDAPFVRVWFGYEKHDGGAGMLGDGAGVLKLLSPLVEFCRSRERMALSTPLELTRVHRLLDSIATYCAELGEGLDFERYVDLRHNEEVNGTSLSEYFAAFRDGRPPGQLAGAAIAEVEKRVVAGLLEAAQPSQREN